MSIDSGFNQKFNTAIPVPGIPQPSQGIRDNFAVIKRAIENLQEARSPEDSIFSIETVQDTDGSIGLSVGYQNNALILPSGDPTSALVPGMVRYHNGVLQIYNGTVWGLVNGVSVEDIIAALELDPSVWVPTPSRHGVMTDPSLHALVIPNGNAGFMSGVDKAKLDTLSLSYNEIVVRSTSGQTSIKPEVGSSAFTLNVLSPLTSSVSGRELTIGLDLPQNIVLANGSPGYMTGADKAKLDLLVATDASVTNRGYMTASDKVKLNNLSQSFNRINVNNGPILASSSAAFEIVGASGISVSAIAGQPKISISLNNIGGYSPSSLATVVANYNAQRSRNTAQIVDTSNEQISHVLNPNATVDILFTWDYAGSTTDIDAFRITVNNSLASTAYTMGTSLVTERVYDVTSDRRSFTLNGAVPDHYYTIFVQGIRYVETDINGAGYLLGSPRKCTVTSKNPYRPETSVSLSGNVVGSINGTPVATVIQNISNAAAGAIWSNITGVGKPHDNADVTSQNVALNTLNIGNKSATEILSTISGLSTNVQSIQQTITQLQSGGTGGSLQSYVTAAQLAQSLAQAAASQVQAQFTSIAQTKILVEQDRTTATAARTAAESARDQAIINANTSTQKASDASGSATTSLGAAQLAQTYASAAGSSAIAAESSNLGAVITVAQTRPDDFARDGAFWVGYTRADQGVTYQDVPDMGRTYRQSSNQPAWIAPTKTFISVAFRKIRATVRARYFSDGIDVNGQRVAIIPKGIDSAGEYHSTSSGYSVAVPGFAAGGLLFASDGWRDFAIDFYADSAFVSQYANFNIWFSWNIDGGLGKIEILRFHVEDVTESDKAEVAASASVTASSAAVVARDNAQTFAQTASQSAVTATTAAGSASTYRTDAAESAQTALGAKTVALQQAGISTNAALDSQTYSSAAAAHAETARSEATRAENSSSAGQAAAVTANTASNNAQTAAQAASGYATTAATKASDAEASSLASAASALQASSSSDAAASSARAASVSADTVVTKSTEAEQSAAAAHQSETAAASYKDGALSSANAATLAAASSKTNATLSQQYADAADLSRLSAVISVASLLPSTFAGKGKYWGTGSTGTITSRSALPPLGTYITDATYGTIFQSDANAGSIGTLGVQQISPDRIYRLTAYVKAITNNTGASSKFTFYAALLSSDLSSETRRSVVGEYDPLTYSTGWTTITKDFTSNDFGSSGYVRPTILYNQTAGNQKIQIREIRIEDVTESKNSATNAAATVDNLKSVIAYRTQTVDYATAAQSSVVQAQTAAGTASASSISAAQSVADALGYKNSAAISQQAAADSATLAGQKSVAAAGFAASAETFSNNASTSAQSALTSSVSASSAAIQTNTTAAQLLPSDFSQDGTYFTNNPIGQTPSSITLGSFKSDVDGARVYFSTGALPSNVSFTRISPSNHFGASGILISDAVDVPCFEYDPVTHVLKGLRVEPSVTNLLLRNNNYTGTANWLAYGSGTLPQMSGAGATSPYGTSSASQIVFPAISITNDYAIVSHSNFTITAQVYTFSIWLKGNSGGETIYLIARNTTQNTRVHSTILTLTQSWVRYSLTFTGTTDSWAMDFGTDLRDNTQASSSAKTVLVFGAQLETGGYVSSYIASGTSAVPKAADVPTINWSGKGVLDGAHNIIYTFDDNSAQTTTVTVASGLSVIPTTLNRKFIRKVEIF